MNRRLVETQGRGANLAADHVQELLGYAAGDARLIGATQLVVALRGPGGVRVLHTYTREGEHLQEAELLAPVTDRLQPGASRAGRLFAGAVIAVLAVVLWECLR